MIHFNIILRDLFSKIFCYHSFFINIQGINHNMIKNENLSKLTHQLCELKLEERRVRSDIRHLVSRNNTIDFSQAKQLKVLRSGVKKQIERIEAKIMPNIIA